MFAIFVSYCILITVTLSLTLLEGVDNYALTPKKLKNSNDCNIFFAYLLFILALIFNPFAFILKLINFYHRNK